MLELVEQVLDLTAADAGRIEVQRVDIEPLPILQECLQHASAAAAAGGITLRGIDPGSARVRALGDTNRLKQVISKLVSNGIKYTPAAGTVRVTLVELGNSVEIAVEDTGAGLTAAQIANIFQPFERLGAEMTAIPGAGLGLAHSKMLVELMGGSIRVESNPGSGSTFTVSLQKGSGLDRA
jgi:signal transduction histidine kinase